MSSIRLYGYKNTTGQIGQNGKTNLSCQLGYFEISTLLCQIGRNDKTTPCRLLSQFDIKFLLGQIRLNNKSTLCRQLGYLVYVAYVVK